MKGSKLLSAGKIENDRSLAQSFPLHAAIIHLRLTSISSNTAQLSNLPGPPPPPLFSPLTSLPAGDSSPSATVAALLQGSCVSGTRNHRAQLRLQLVRGGCVARLSDRISVTLRTELLKMDQRFVFFHPTSPPSLARFRHSSRQLLHFLIPPLISLFLALCPSLHLRICGRG